MAADAVTEATWLGGRWNRFWYASGSPLSLGIFRALFAVCLAFEVPNTRSRSLFAIEGGFHLPYLPFIKPVSPEMYLAIHQVQYPFIALLGLGILPRFSAGMLLGLQGYVFFSDQLNFRNHPYFFLLLLLFLTFSPAGASFSIPALIRRMRKSGHHGESMVGVIAPLTMQRLMQVQVSIVYFYAALHKMTPQFLGGHFLADQMAGSIFTGRVGAVLAALVSPASLESLRATVGRPGFWVVPACATVFLELSLSFALWIPRVRVAAMLFGVPFHLAIAYLMDINTFSAAMISSYLLFLDPDTVPQIWQRVRGRFVARSLTSGALSPAVLPRRAPARTGGSGKRRRP